MSHSPDTFFPLLFPVALKDGGNDLRLRDTSHVIGEWPAVSSAVNRLRIERIKIGFHSWQMGSDLGQGSCREVSAAEDWFLFDR